MTVTEVFALNNIEARGAVPALRQCETTSAERPELAWPGETKQSYTQSMLPAASASASSRAWILSHVPSVEKR